MLLTHCSYVPAVLKEGRDEFIARHRDKKDVVTDTLFLELLVGVLLEKQERIIGQTPLGGLVGKIVGL